MPHGAVQKNKAEAERTWHRVERWRPVVIQPNTLSVADGSACEAHAKWGGGVVLKGCTELLTCTQIDDLCPSFKGASGSDQEEFYNACVSNPLCESRVSIILGKECRDRIETVSGLSADFKALCEGADDGDSDSDGNG